MVTVVVVHGFVLRSLVRDDVNGRWGNLRNWSNMDGERILNVRKLVGVDRAVVIGVKNIVIWFIGIVKIIVVSIEVHGVVAAPFDDGPSSLDEGLFFELCESSNSCNGSVGDGELLRAMSGEAETSDKGQKLVVPL